MQTLTIKITYIGDSLNHKFKFAFQNSTMGYLCRTDLRAGIILFTIIMSIYFIELKFIYLTLFLYCYIKDFKFMMSQIDKQL